MLYVVGIILLVVAAGLLLWRRSQQGKLRVILGTETTTVKEITDLGTSVRQELSGQTGFHQPCELKGVIRCDNPLTSEIAKQPCVYYSMTVTREYEETYTETDSRTNQQVQKTRRSTDQVAHSTQMVPFWLEDDTGRIPVDPQGADVDAVQVADRYEPANELQLGLSLGGINLSLGGLGGVGSRTLGYRYRESILPPDRKVFLLGEASDTSGVLTVQKPQEKGAKFLISLKSEEELIASAQRTINWLLYGSVASGVLGIAALVAGFVRR